MDDRELRAAPQFGPPLDASGVLEADIPTEASVGDDGSAGRAGIGGTRATGGRPSTGGAHETGGLDASGGEGGAHFSTGGVQSETGGSSAGSGGSTGGMIGTGGAPIGTGGVMLPSTGGRPGLGDCSGPDGVGGDCGPTLVQNATFDSDVAHWIAESSATGKWRASNWSGTSGGSMTVTNALHADAGGLNMGGVTQCVPAVPFKQYDVSARVYIPSGQQNADCKGTLLDTVVTSSTLDKDAWSLVGGRVNAPARTQSMLVRLIGMKPLRQSSLEVWFDAIGVYAL